MKYLKIKRILIIISAYLLYVIGLLKIIDWMIFWENNKKSAIEHHSEFINRYIEHLPHYLRPVFTTKPEMAAVISVIIFAIAGIILIKEKNIIHKIVGWSAFFFGFCNLFSIM